MNGTPKHDTHDPAEALGSDDLPAPAEPLAPPLAARAEAAPKPAPIRGPAALFELDTPGLPAPNATAPAAPKAARSALFELELPGAPPPPPAAAAHAAANETAPTQRSTMEVLFEIEAPSRATSRTIDFDAEAPPPDDIADVEPGPAPKQPAQCSELPDLSLLQAEPESARTGSTDGAQERARRVVLRIVACRDTLRLMSALKVPEAERAAAARSLMNLDGLVARAEGAASVVKDPEAALQTATPDELTAVEAAISAIEDKLLWLDESIAQASFDEIEIGKQTKRLLGRYARLLASRRFMAGPRRDRFEWIAARLLVVSDAQGVQTVAPPERARSVLHYMLSDAPRKAKADELTEAIAYLQDALVRLDSIESHEEFFESGFFLDVHGYKVSMRELLVAPEFVYLSVLVNVRVHNRLEQWIEARERLLRANIAVEGSLRDDVRRLLQEQESAVDEIFSIKRRPTTLTSTADATAEPEAKPRGKRKKKTKTKTKRGFRFQLADLDRTHVFQMLALLGVIASITLVLFQAKVVGAPQVKALTDVEIANVSTLLVRGWIKGSGNSAYLDAMIRRDAWAALDPRKRTSEVDRIATQLATRGIHNAIISDRAGGKIAEIQSGLAAYVQGGKL